VPYSEEQQEIIQSTDYLLRVKAFAGTGKTTTLVGYAQARPSVPMLYVAFNKSVQLSAQRKFPPNVECRTSHSLAFGAVGRLYAHKLGNIKAYQVARLYRINYASAQVALNTINNFLASPDPKLDIQHVELPEKVVQQSDADNIADRTLVVATSIWERMANSDDSAVLLPHDGYLKLWQINQPHLPKYQVILFDEAQDANPVTTDVVLNQPCARIFVGDPHQAIYGFRGARDAMEQLGEEKTLYLTKSWRFGHTIADVANIILSRFKKEQVALKGASKFESVLGAVDEKSPFAMLARGNVAVFDQAVHALKKKKRLFFIGGIAGYQFERIHDAYSLKYGGKVRDAEIGSFHSFDAMEEQAREADDRELIALGKVVRHYDRAIPDLVRQVQRAAVNNPKEAQVYLATTHKAKGLEFRQVRLANDFPDLVDESGHPQNDQELNMEEVNIIYVAITRARLVLELSPTLKDLLTVLGKQSESKLEQK
jgi:hypothetical protein